MRGTPETWGKLGPLPDVMGTIVTDLEATVHRAMRAGVDKSRIVVDPGLGFGKRKEQNSEVLARLDQLLGLSFPVMVGPSRKSFLARPSEEETSFANAAAVAVAIMQGAHLIRVHEVKQMRIAAQVADAVITAMPEV
jgi:dihydropteroate synthase